MARLNPILKQRVAAYELQQDELALQLRKKEEQRQRYQQPSGFHQPSSDEYFQRQISDQDHTENLQSIRFLRDTLDASPSANNAAYTRKDQHGYSVSYPSQQYTSKYSPHTPQPIGSGPPPLPSKPFSPEVLTPIVHPQPPLPAKVKLPTPAKIPEFRSTCATEGGAPLRTVFLPESLRSRFLQIALPNTNRNLETCGMLCGKLQHNAFFITHLAIPHQESTSDTCTTTHEELLFEYLDKNDLFILGWIHTHPTQSCFMSSVDLHTQNSYQIMLPESIAIVCSPQHEPAWGVFRLTDPNGINLLKQCNKSGFHPHPEPDMYRSAHNPGHILLRSDIPFTVEDLRTRNIEQ